MTFGIRGAFGNEETHPSGQCSMLPMETVTVSVLSAEAGTITHAKGEIVHLEYSGGGWTADALVAADIVHADAQGGLFGITAESFVGGTVGKVHIKGRVEVISGATITSGSPFTGEINSLVGNANAAAKDTDSVVLGIVAEADLSDGFLGFVYFDCFCRGNLPTTTS